MTVEQLLKTLFAFRIIKVNLSPINVNFESKYTVNQGQF